MFDFLKMYIVIRPIKQVYEFVVSNEHMRLMLENKEDFLRIDTGDAQTDKMIISGILLTLQAAQKIRDDDIDIAGIINDISILNGIPFNDTVDVKSSISAFKTAEEFNNAVAQVQKRPLVH